jgi:hypothetical protein
MEGRPDDAIDCPRCGGDGWLSEDLGGRKPKEDLKCVKCGKLVGTNSGHDLINQGVLPELTGPDNKHPIIRLREPLKLCHVCFGKKSDEIERAWEGHEEELAIQAAKQREKSIISLIPNDPDLMDRK